MAPKTAMVTECYQPTIVEPRTCRSDLLLPTARGSELLLPLHTWICRRLHPEPLELLEPSLEGRAAIGAHAATGGRATTGGLVATRAPLAASKAREARSLGTSASHRQQSEVRRRETREKENERDG